MLKVEFILPTEEKEYNFFNEEYEKDPTIAFHCTPSKNFESICRDGFKSAKKLNNGSSTLSSISFAKNSSQCLSYMGKPIKNDFYVFAVQFDPNLSSLKTTDLYIYIDDNCDQPIILSYCYVSKGINYF